MLKVQGISSRAKDGSYTFTAHLELDGKPIDLPVSVDELLSYSAFQKCIAKQIGQLPILGVCEHRTPESADSAWRAEVAMCLALEAPKTSTKMN